MRRPALNFLIDVLAFAAFVLVTATGVLMRYVLPPGSGRLTSVWGWDRHGWGGLHFWLAVSFLGLLALHLLLHWRWLASTVQGRQREGSGRRVALGLVGLLALLALAAAPFLSPVDQTERPRRGRISDSESLDSQEREEGAGIGRGYGMGRRHER